MVLRPYYVALAYLTLAALLLAFPLAAAISQPVKIETGLVSGIPGADPSITAFKGIPYAQPPVGDLRWRAPRLPAAWQGVRKADQFGNSCIQNIVEKRDPWTYEFMAHNEISEDCLFLNVWTAAKAAGEKRPVLMFIHGGGFTEGSAAVPVYEGEALARKGLVVVTLNYRLGVLGFLAHPELTKESDRNASGNYGLLDQVAALEWIKKNIAAFGGDPGRVTIAGQSAGAGSVHALTASPLAKGLFVGAIADSGSSVGGAPPMTLAEAEANGVKFAESKGARSLKELRALPWKQVWNGPLGGAPPAPAPFQFRPIVDGYLLPASIPDIFAQGKQNDVVTLTGMNYREGNGTLPAEGYEEEARKRYGAMAGEFLKLYPAAASAADSAREQGMVSMYLWAANRAKTAKTKVYTYLWDHPLPGPDAAKFGPFHTSELPYFFNNLKANRPFTDVDRKIADTLSNYWVNFATHGDPNGKGQPAWTAFATNSKTTMEIGDRMMSRPLPDAIKFAFFEQFLTKPAAR